jgi:hypothetical protein
LGYCVKEGGGGEGEREKERALGMPQPSILRLILNVAALEAASPFALQ